MLMYARFVYHDFNCTMFLAAPDGHMFVGNQCYSVKASRLAVRRVEMTALSPQPACFRPHGRSVLGESFCYFNCKWHQGWLKACP